MVESKPLLQDASNHNDETDLRLTSLILFQIFHEMETAGVKANAHTFGAMIDGCARAGQLPKAFGAYGIMMAKVQRSFFLFLSYTVP